MDVRRLRLRLPQQVEDALSVELFEDDVRDRQQRYVARLVQNGAWQGHWIIVAGSWIFLVRPLLGEGLIKAGTGSVPAAWDSATADASWSASGCRLPRHAWVQSSRQVAASALANGTELLVALIAHCSEAPSDRAGRLQASAVLRMLIITKPVSDGRPAGSPEVQRPSNSTRNGRTLLVSSRELPLAELLAADETPEQVMDIFCFDRGRRVALVLGSQQLVTIRLDPTVSVLRGRQTEGRAKAATALRRWLQQWRTWTRVPSRCMQDTHRAEDYACMYGYGGYLCSKRDAATWDCWILRQSQIETWQVTDTQVTLRSVSSAVFERLSQVLQVHRSDLIPLYLGTADHGTHAVLGAATFSVAESEESNQEAATAASESDQLRPDHGEYQLQLWVTPVSVRHHPESIWELGGPVPLANVRVAAVEEVFLHFYWTCADGLVFVFDQCSGMLFWASAAWGLAAAQQVRGQIALSLDASFGDSSSVICGFGASSETGVLCMHADCRVDQILLPYRAPTGVESAASEADVLSGRDAFPRRAIWEQVLNILALEAAGERSAALASFHNARSRWNREHLSIAVRQIHEHILKRNLNCIVQGALEQQVLEMQREWMRRLCSFLLAHSALGCADDAKEKLWDDLPLSERLNISQSIYSIYILYALRCMLNAKSSSAWDVLDRQIQALSAAERAPGDNVQGILSVMNEFYTSERARFLASEDDVSADYVQSLLQVARYATGLILDGVCIVRTALPELQELERRACPWLHSSKSPLNLLLRGVTEELPTYLARQKRLQTASALATLYHVVQARIELERAVDSGTVESRPGPVTMLEHLRLAGFVDEASRLARHYGIYEILMRIAQDTEEALEDPDSASAFLETCFAELGRPFAWYAFDWWHERHEFVKLFAYKSPLLREWLQERQHHEWLWLQLLFDGDYANAAQDLLRIEKDCTDDVDDALFYLSIAVLCCRAANPDDRALEMQARLRLQRARAYQRLGCSKFQDFDELVNWFRETGARAPLTALSSNALLLLQIADAEGKSLDAIGLVLDAVVQRELHLWQRLTEQGHEMNDVEKELLLSQTAFYQVLRQRQELAHHPALLDYLTACQEQAAPYIAFCFERARQSSSPPRNLVSAEASANATHTLAASNAHAHSA